MVVALIGIVAFAVAPSGREIMVTNSVRSAKQEAAASLAVARASAIHNGRPTRLVRNGSVLHVRLNVGAQLDTVGAPIDLAKEHKVTVQMSPDSIRFDSRGFALGIPGTYQTIRFSRGTTRDSVCVTRFGRIITEGSCQ
jgi:Tfp pilus assembly protein FimT